MTVTHEPVTNVSSDEPVTVPVKLTDADLAYIRAAGENTPVFAAWQSFVFTGIPADTQPIQILPADLKRRRAYLQVRGTLGAPGQVEGSVTSPGANVAIANMAATALAPGWYTVQWAVELDGTVSATDENNFILKGPGLGAGLNDTNDAAVGRYPQPTVTIYVPAGNGTALSVRSVGAGTVGAIYSAQISVTPLVVNGGFVLVGQLGQVSNGQGGKIIPGDPRWEIRAHSSLYIAGDGATAVNVTLYVERDQE
jgi:hypothetical protein